jgi:hypothetical protein
MPLIPYSIRVIARTVSVIGHMMGLAWLDTHMALLFPSVM